MWMGILFDELFIIFREVSMIEATWLSVPTPNYMAEAIVNGPYPHD